MFNSSKKHPNNFFWSGTGERWMTSGRLVDGKWTLKSHLAVPMPSTHALSFGRQVDGIWTAIAGRVSEITEV